MTDLLISGHGKARSGRIDPGATGIIAKGEHRYMKEDLFPAMKKHVGDADVVFFSEYDVYEHGNIVELARKYGKDTRVIEFHYDAGVPEASGGHVIVSAKYKADTLDLRLRDAINDMVGVRYSHNGVKGISGRDNLANVNRTAQAGVNYRLVELGFGTNKKDADVLVNQTDTYAKRLVEAILGKGVTAKPTPVKPKPVPPVAKPKPVKQSNHEVAQDVIKGFYGNGSDRMKNVEKAGYSYNDVQAEVNKILNVKTTPKIPQVKVDGYLGKETIKSMQRYFGTPVDGKLSNPSLVIKKLQAKIGTKVDGYLGYNSIASLQKYLKTPVDGKLDKPSMVIKELQRRLNSNDL